MEKKSQKLQNGFLGRVAFNENFWGGVALNHPLGRCFDESKVPPVGHFLFNQELCVELQRRASDSARAEGQDSVDLVDAGDDRQEYEPEPHEDVDLLVDDVDRKNAKAVVVLELSKSNLAFPMKM